MVRDAKRLRSGVLKYTEERRNQKRDRELQKYHEPRKSFRHVMNILPDVSEYKDTHAEQGVHKCGKSAEKGGRHHRLLKSGATVC